jgi:hypothetical protein
MQLEPRMTRNLRGAVTLGGAVVLVGVSAAAGVVQRQRTDAMYTCRATGVAELMDDGSLRPLDRFAAGWDSPFHVDRATGLIAGGPANNVTDPSTEVVFTPPSNPFYVISKSGGANRHVNLLSVRDYTPGPRKPFLFVNSSWVYSGVCE